MKLYLKNCTFLGKTNVRRVNHANYHRGLSLLVDIRSDDYFIATDDFEGTVYILGQ